MSTNHMRISDYVEQLRLLELDRALTWISRPCRILEIGAGTGWQARRLAQLGHDVEAVDLPDGQYTTQRVWLIRDFDGVNLPFADDSFDVVFSSNVLEHVENLPGLLRESMRVVSPSGYLIHVVPSATWRFWTTITYYPDLVRKAAKAVANVIANRSGHGSSAGDAHIGGASRPRNPMRFLVPPAHGTLGTVWTEMWHFRRRSWRARLVEADFEVIESCGVGVFYSGSILFGLRIPFTLRHWLSHILGSSTHLLVCAKRRADP